MENEGMEKKVEPPKVPDSILEFLEKNKALPTKVIGPNDSFRVTIHNNLIQTGNGFESAGKTIVREINGQVVDVEEIFNKKQETDNKDAGDC